MSMTCEPDMQCGGQIPIQHKNSKKNEDENGGMGIAHTYNKHIFLLVSVP